MTMYVNYNELGECIVFTPHVNMMNEKGQSVRIFDNNNSIKNQKKKKLMIALFVLKLLKKIIVL